MSNIDETFAAKDKKTSPWKISCLIVFINLFIIPFFLWGIDEAYAAWQLQTNGIITRGTVVRLEEEYSEGECCVYRPVIEFEVNNQVYTFNSTWASDPPKYQVGDQVNVRYDPTGPSVAQIDSYFERWSIPGMLLPGTIFMTLFANIVLLRKWMSAKASSDQL